MGGGGWVMLLKITGVSKLIGGALKPMSNFRFRSIGNTGYNCNSEITALVLTLVLWFSHLIVTSLLL